MAQTVMLVDDDPQLRHVVSMFFELEGYNVVQARDGREAITMLAEYVPDVILLDLMMPDVSGLEVCQHVRADRRLKDIPVVVFTAAEMQEEELSAAGADRFITKPYSLEGLRRVVRTLIKESAGTRAK
ncbi:MAG: two-component system, OmpR family, response regulator RpaA [Chloroflexota bacterium]|jgi:CheY-like chemotaxis protein|nr:two-component system, OmpR family, response regulator RpaA [Chloroflexota bacterium]